MIRKFTLREQFMYEIRNKLGDRNYRINFDFYEDIKTGSELYDEFHQLIVHLAYYYKIYDKFDYITFTNKLPQYCDILNEIFACDINNPFLEKEDIVFEVKEEDNFNAEVEFWQENGIH